MTKQQRNILKAAIEVFMRYGIRRTTMNDIAAQAGIVRQTLYKVYSSKDEVLCAAIRYFSEKSLKAIKQDWQEVENLGDKLDIYFNHAIYASYANVKASPDAADMIDGYNAAGKAEIQSVQEQKKHALAAILAPYEDTISEAGLTVDQYADFILLASIGLRDAAQNEQQLRSLLGALKANILSLTSGH
jgi:AcrR family transcriptional regulator